MSDQPISPPAPSTKSLDDILNQLEKSAGKSPAMPEPQPMVPVPSNQNPILSNTQAAVPPTPAPASEENTMQPEPAPVIETPTVVPQVPSEPAPVATLPENPIAAPPPQERPEAAPMVKEEPIIDKQKAVEAPLPPPPPGEVSVETPAPKPYNKGKIIAGVIGVLLLTGVAGIGVYFSRQQQNTQGAAYAPPTPLVRQSPSAAATQQPNSSPSSTSTPKPLSQEELQALALNRVRVSGKVCSDKVGTPGYLTLYNITLKVASIVPIAKGQTTFQSVSPTGDVVAAYQNLDSKKSLGYTDTKGNLKVFTLTQQQPGENIEVCDENVNPTTIPSDAYTVLP